MFTPDLSANLPPALQLLPWDTRFLGFPVGQIEMPVYDEIALETVRQHARQQGIKLLYVFTNTDTDTGLNQKSTHTDPGYLVDTKQTYCCELDKTQPAEVSGAIQKFSVEQDVTQLYELAYQSGEYSRFKVDAAVGNGNFRRLYRQWVDNSLSGKVADDLFVYVADESILGFITVLKKEIVATIGLMATDKSRRGRGIGRALLSYVKHTLLPTPVVRLEVATQKKNTTACRFYERNGFVLNHEVSVYHLWL